MGKPAQAISAIQGQIPGARGYLATASIGLPAPTVTRAIHEALDAWAAGDWTAPMFEATVATARESYANLVGVSPSWVTVNSNVSSLVGLVAASLACGSEVLCVSGDFSSLLFPFLERAARGELIIREVEQDALAESVCAQTTLVAVSAVQSASGRVANLGALRDAASHFGAQVMLDATQASGWLSYPVADFDYVVTAAYKWLMAPRGVAFMSVRPERLPAIPALGAGWFAGERIADSYYGSPLRLATTARRLDVSPAWLCWLGAVPALALLEGIGLEATGKHNVALANLFLEAIGSDAQESAIVSLEGEAIGDALADAGFKTNSRAGRTRLAFHIYNTEDDARGAAEVVRRTRR